jgi:hypothetical protein
MLKLIVMRVRGLVMARFTTAYTQLTTWLSKTAKRLRVLIIQTYHSVLTLLLLLVQIWWSFKAWAVSLITQVQSIKHVLSTAKAKVIQIGLQLRTTVLPTRQRARPSRKKGK